MRTGAPSVALLFLGASLFLLVGCSGASFNHSLAYSMTAVSEPGPGLPAFSMVGYLDDQCIMHYDSNGRRIQFRAHWIEDVGKEDPQYWIWKTQIAKGSELRLCQELEVLQDLYNQSGGLQTLQLVFHCQVSQAGHREGFVRYGFDGNDFLALDTKTQTWMAAEAKDQEAKKRWDAQSAGRPNRKSFVEETCIEWLQKYLPHAMETLLRKVPPEVKVTCKDGQEDFDTLLCQIHGFYPKEIDVTWRKDGEVQQGATFHGVISPNVDGTYYTWLSIEIDPKERSHYRCHVEHDGLQDPLDMAVEESASVPVWFIVGGILGALVPFVTVIALYIRQGKGPVGSLHLKRLPPTQHASLDVDLGYRPVLFQSEGPEATDSELHCGGASRG